ncbi:hypothetical protein Pelo_1008 [Pelomyxa schiedti]|nr:hypothetical protein Pelo_1008 [Pelomyxa schiedti]
MSPERYSWIREQLRAQYRCDSTSNPCRFTLKLFGAAVEGGPRGAHRASKLAAATPVGQECSTSWSRWNNTHKTSLSVLHVCALLGHVDVMGAILGAWAQRAPPASSSPSLPQSPPLRPLDGLVTDPRRDGEEPGGEMENAGEGTQRARAERVQWLVDGTGSGNCTALVYAVQEGNIGAAECLLREWVADPSVLCDPNSGNPFVILPKVPGTDRLSVLHLAAFHNNYEMAELILSCSHGRKLDTLMNSPGDGKLRALDVAIYCGHIEVVRLILDPRWGTKPKKSPLLFCSRISDRAEILSILCQHYTKGLCDAFISCLSNPSYWKVLMAHPNLSQCINIHSKDGATPLFAATVREYPDIALKLLDLGADPNISCRGLTPYWCTFEENLRTPIVMAVGTNQQSLVREMARHGGILQEEFCHLWGKGDPLFSLASYLDGSWAEHIRAQTAYESELPPAPGPHTQLLLSLSLSEAVPTATIENDPSIMSLLIHFTPEMTGVLEFLDIKSLGRIQQTSRFWYHFGRTNSLWKSALLNTSRSWDTEQQSHVQWQVLHLDTNIKWKHACFYWMAKNLCKGCNLMYRNYHPGTCGTDPQGQHKPTVFMPELAQFKKKS